MLTRDLILLQPLVDAVAMEQVHVAARKSPQSIAGSEIAQAHRAVRVRRYLNETLSMYFRDDKCIFQVEAFSKRTFVSL